MSIFDSALRAINTAGMTDLETTVFKGTYPDENKAKEKHVESLLRMTDQYRCDVMVRLLGARIREKEWCVVLKALSVAHRLMREANPKFFEACTVFPIFSGLGNFLDERSTLAWGQSRFIREYAGYLEEKTEVLKTVGKCVELMPAKDGGEWVRKLKFLKLKEVLPRLQIQFDKLIKCDPYTDEGGLHEVAVLPMLQLIKDGFRLYSVLTIAIFQQLNRWQQMTRREGLFFLDCYEKFVKQTQGFKAWAFKMVKLGLVDKEVLPEFDNLPENLIPTLDEYFRKNYTGDADDDDADEDADEEEPSRGRRGSATQAPNSGSGRRPAAGNAGPAPRSNGGASRPAAAAPASSRGGAAASRPRAQPQPAQEEFDFLDFGSPSAVTTQAPPPAASRKPAAQAAAARPTSAARPAAAAQAPARRPAPQAQPARRAPQPQYDDEPEQYEDDGGYDDGYAEEEHYDEEYHDDYQAGAPEEEDYEEEPAPAPVRRPAAQPARGGAAAARPAPQSSRPAQQPQARPAPAAAAAAPASQRRPPPQNPKPASQAVLDLDELFATPASSAPAPQSRPAPATAAPAQRSQQPRAQPARRPAPQAQYEDEDNPFDDASAPAPAPARGGRAPANDAFSNVNAFDFGLEPADDVPQQPAPRTAPRPGSSRPAARRPAPQAQQDVDPFDFR